VAALATGNVVDILAEKPRDVREDADGEDAGQRQRGERASDDLTGVQRVTYGDVATDGHGDRQPRARHNEHVDDRVAVRRVHNPEVVLTGAEDAGADVCSRQDGDTEQGIRYRQTCTKCT